MLKAKPFWTSFSILIVCLLLTTGVFAFQSSLTDRLTGDSSTGGTSEDANPGLTTPPTLTFSVTKDIKLQTSTPFERELTIVIPEGHHAYLPGSNPNLIILHAGTDTQFDRYYDRKPYLIVPSGTTEDGNNVIRGTFTAKIAFTPSCNLDSNVRELQITLVSQLCNDQSGICYVPDYGTMITLSVVSLDKTCSPTFISSLESLIRDNLRRFYIVIPLMMLLGFILFANPCNYPMIPLTISFIGARTAGSQGKGFILSLVYVLGMSLIYAFLTIIVLLTIGRAVGTVSYSLPVLLLLVVLFAYLTLAMIGKLPFNLPTFLLELKDKTAQKGRGSFWGAFAMGCISGVVNSPCTGPVIGMLIAILTIQNYEELLGIKDRTLATLYVGLLLFSFGFGMGIPYIILGTFTSFLKKIPKAGGWMNTVKWLFGSLMAIATIWFIVIAVPLFAKDLQQGVITLIAIGFLVMGIVLVRSYRYTERQKRRAPVLVLSLLLLVGGLSGWSYSIYDVIAPKNTTYGQDLLAKGLKDAATSGKPLFIDFYADWCINCHHFKEAHEKNATLKSILSAATFIVYDYEKDPAFAKKRFNVANLPHFLCIDQNGNELFRISGFEDISLLINELKVKLNANLQ